MPCQDSPPSKTKSMALSCCAWKVKTDIVIGRLKSMFWIIKALFGKCADPNVGPQMGSKHRLKRLRERKPEPDHKDQMTTAKNVQQILEQHIANEKRTTLDGISKWQMGRGQANRVPAAFGNAFVTPAKGTGF